MKAHLTLKIQDPELGKGWYKISPAVNHTGETPDDVLLAFVRRAYSTAAAVQIIREYKVTE